MPTRVARARLRPRKTPSQPRSKHMVGTIVEAAARILETDGLAGFNTNAVAERAGISVGSLYQYFPGKEALLAALSQRERASLADDIARTAGDAAHLGLEDALRRLVRTAIAHQLARPALARILDFEEQRLALDEQDRAVTRSIAREVGAVLAAHRRRIRVEDLEGAALDLVAMTRALIDAAAARGRIDPGAVEGRATRAALGYLTGRANVAR